MSRTLKLVVLVLLAALIQPGPAGADDVQLNRQEVKIIKHKLVAVEEALGQPPAGYGKAHESFNLPTSVSKLDKGSYGLLYASAQFSFDGGSENMSRKSQAEIESEYRKKMLEAQASGNYQAMSQIAQDMMQKAGQAQMAADEAKRVPVEVNLSFNNNPGATIDPDAVVFEHPGVIALKASDSDNENLQVTVYFDPVKLKDTESLSRIDLGNDDDGAKSKTTVRNIIIEMNGPAEVVENWSKKISTAKVLSQIDAK